MIKKIFFILISIFFIVSNVSANEPRIYVNGKRVDSSVIMSEDLTYVPLRAISESMGANVEWDEALNAVFISYSTDDMIANTVANTSPSVVTIVGNYNGGSNTNYYNFNKPTAHGSGVIYKSNGYIITNAHVIKDITNLTVILNDGRSFPASVLLSDEVGDLAILKIDCIGLTAIRFADPNTISSGKTAIAIGTPISLTMRNTITKGIISGVDVSLPSSYYKLIQTDCTINPGNSGGPLVNINGELMGINSSKYVSYDVENTCFAIPIDTVVYVINQYENNGMIMRPKFDFSLEQSWEAEIGIPTTKGLTIRNSNDPNFPNGAIIKSVNDIEVHSITDWNEALKDTYSTYGINVEFYN